MQRSQGQTLPGNEPCAGNDARTRECHQQQRKTKNTWPQHQRPEAGEDQLAHVRRYGETNQAEAALPDGWELEDEEKEKEKINIKVELKMQMKIKIKIKTKTPLALSTLDRH